MPEGEREPPSHTPAPAQQVASDPQFGSASKLCDLGSLSTPCLHFLIIKWALNQRLDSCVPQAFLLGPSALSSSVGSGLWLQTCGAAWFGCLNSVPMPPRALSPPWLQPPVLTLIVQLVKERGAGEETWEF